MDAASRKHRRKPLKRKRWSMTEAEFRAFKAACERMKARERKERSR